MKFKEFAIWPFMGLDLTPRKSYRYRLSLNAGAIAQQRAEIDDQKKKIDELTTLLEQEKEYNKCSEEVNRKLEAEKKVMQDELKRLDGETKRQYKAYKALADRQEETEKELDAALAAKKSVEIDNAALQHDNAMLQEKVEWQMRKIKKLDQPRKKGRFSKNHSEPSFAPDAPSAEEIAEAVAVVEEVAEAEVEVVEPDTTGAPEPIGEVMATAEVVPEEA